MFDVLAFDNGLSVQTPKGIISSTDTQTSSRQVFMFDEFVVKFECNAQNEKELYFYQELLEEKDAKFFPKLLGSGYHNGELFIIQERVYHISTRQASRKQQVQYRYLVAKYGLCDLTLVNRQKERFKPSMCWNLALTRSGLKIFDIGINNAANDIYGYGSDDYSNCSCSDCCPADYSNSNQESFNWDF